MTFQFKVLIGEKTKAQDSSVTPFAFKLNSNVAYFPYTKKVWT